LAAPWGEQRLQAGTPRSGSRLFDATLPARGGCAMATTQHLQSVCVFMITGVFALGLACSAPADIIHVPDDYPTIQEAIDAAFDGDEIAVAPGTYNETIDFFGNAIWLHSTDGPEVTIIDAAYPDPPMSVVTCVNGEGPNTVLEGFTITGGTGTGPESETCGGGMLSFESSPTVRECLFMDNRSRDGAGMSIIFGAPNISGCLFWDNIAESTCIDEYGFPYPCGSGGGIDINASELQIIECEFFGNYAITGGAINSFYCDIEATNCTFAMNAAHESGAVKDIYGGGNYANCVFIGNSATRAGAVEVGRWGDGQTSTVVDCLFVGNFTFDEHSFGDGGGALIARNESVIIGSTFTGNSSVRGGAIYCRGTSTIINCDFIANGAGAGAAIGIRNASPLVVNALFVSNTAARGAAVCVASCDDTHSCPRIVNCTMAANFSPAGSAIACASQEDEYWSDVFVSNCVLWNDGHEVHVGDSSTLTIVFSDIDGGFPGVGNIDADPLFVDPQSGDFRLSSGSPCIDAGDNTAVPPDESDLDEDDDAEEPIPVDLDWNPRFVDDPETEDTGYGTPPIVDMGAYELQVEESCPADFDGNGVVNTADLLHLLGCWGQACGDVNGDGNTDTADLLTLLGAWGECP
jgi:predicted outer membrane repeat protein